MKQYLGFLEEENNLLVHPGQIYNVDESWIPLAPNVVTKKGVKKIRYRSAGSGGPCMVMLQKMMPDRPFQVPHLLLQGFLNQLILTPTCTVTLTMT